MSRATSPPGPHPAVTPTEILTEPEQPRAGSSAAMVALTGVVVSIVPVVAHVAEDVALGVQGRFGLTALAGGLVAGAALAFEVSLAILCRRRSRPACLGLVVVSLGWAVFSAVDHPGAHRLWTYRGSLASWLVLWSMILLQAIVAVAAAAAARAARRGTAQARRT